MEQLLSTPQEEGGVAMELPSPPTPAALPVLVYGPAGLLPKAFSLGCTDFLTDPWAYPELKTRVLRHLPPPILHIEGGRYLLQHGRLLPLDTEEDEAVDLSFPEALILRLLILHGGRAVYRETLQYALWGERRSASRAVDMHITSLRKKLASLSRGIEGPGGAGGGAKMIRTVRNVGYLLVDNLCKK